MTDLSLKTATPATAATEAEPSLQRVMGPWLLLLFIVGDILGPGFSAYGITITGLVFMAVVAAVNFRGVGESVKANVVLTCVELTGLLIIIGVGVWALGGGGGDFSRVVEFDTGERSLLGGVIAATRLAFFAVGGFEDSVNLAEAG